MAHQAVGGALKETGAKNKGFRPDGHGPLITEPLKLYKYILGLGIKLLLKCSQYIFSCFYEEH